MTMDPMLAISKPILVCSVNKEDAVTQLDVCSVKVCCARDYLEILLPAANIPRAPAMKELLSMPHKDAYPWAVVWSDTLL